MCARPPLPTCRLSLDGDGRAAADTPLIQASIDPCYSCTTGSEVRPDDSAPACEFLDRLSESGPALICGEDSLSHKLLTMPPDAEECAQRQFAHGPAF